MSKPNKPRATQGSFLVLLAAVVSFTTAARLTPAQTTTACSPPTPIDVPVSKISSEFRLIGWLGEPLGSPVTVQGIVVDAYCKINSGGPIILVERINGRATQADIRLPLRADWGHFGRENANGTSLPKPITGVTFEFEGYESGGYVGMPPGVMEKTGNVVQTSDHYFRVVFVAYMGKRITAIRFSPADFVGREALIEGKAFSNNGKSLISSGQWKLLADDKAPWPKRVEGKLVEGLGVIRATGKVNEYRLESGITRLVLLSDQVGQEVVLRGTARSMNGRWWFNYRGTDIEVKDMSRLPGWSAECHWRPMEIRGLLTEGTWRPPVYSPGKQDSAQRKCYIVRKASWKPIDALLSPERPVAP